MDVPRWLASHSSHAFSPSSSLVFTMFLRAMLTAFLSLAHSIMMFSL